MSVISKYTCNNEKCDFEVNLGEGFPVWKEGTPERLQRVPVREHNKPYVLEIVSSKLCKKCGVVVEVEKATYICPSCAEAHSFLKLDDKCPVCHVGIIKEDTNGRVWF